MPHPPGFSPDDLAYDILIQDSQLSEAIQLVDACPNQTFILDHLAKPRIKERCIDAWARQLLELSERDNVYCNLSGPGDRG